MWRRPLKSVVLAATIHRGLKGVSDGMGTQVEIQMINKCKVQMIRKELLLPSHFVYPLFHFEMSQNIVLFLKIKVINLLMFLLYPY